MVARTREQLPLWERYNASSPKTELHDAAAADNKTQPIHRWVPWIAGFSAQFAADAIDAYLPRAKRDEALVLDPFAGVATTLVEALKVGCNVVGYDVNPFAVLAARAKLNCVDVSVSDFGGEVDAFRAAMQHFEAEVDARYAPGDEHAYAAFVSDTGLIPPTNFRSRIPFFSPPVQTKFLYALRHTETLLEPNRSLFRAVLGATMISYSNYSYEPSLSSRPGAGKPLIENAAVGLAVCRKLDEVLQDVGWIESRYGASWRGRQRVMHRASYFDSALEADSISLLVTSPPYMNNYHYVRNTRAQLHWLGLIQSIGDLQPLEKSSFGKFWQTVRQAPQISLIPDFPELARALEHLRTLSPEKGVYGGRGWANYVATYFNDTFRLLGLVQSHLKPGAHAVIVVGNSIIQGIEFKVDHLLAQMAEQRGLYAEDIQIVRTKRVGNSIIDSSVRNGDASGAKRPTQLYDAAVILRA